MPLKSGKRENKIIEIPPITDKTIQKIRIFLEYIILLLIFQFLLKLLFFGDLQNKFLLVQVF